jgi:hypothetical protein
MYHGHGHYNEKYLYESMIMATGTGQWGNTPMILMDYLLYYPFIDEGSTDKQMMDNTESLPRYQNDKNIQMMAVSLGGRIGGQTMQIEYVNQDGVSGRITPLIMGNNSSNTNGTLMNTSGLLSITGATPFLPLQAGDTGVRSIESVQMISGVDTGIFALVLVKPLVFTPIFDSVIPSYKNAISDNGCFPIKIEDDAYLNILICSNGGYAGQTLLGYFNFLVK